MAPPSPPNDGSKKPPTVPGVARPQVPGGPPKLKAALPTAPAPPTVAPLPPIPSVRPLVTPARGLPIVPLAPQAPPKIAPLAAPRMPVIPPVSAPQRAAASAPAGQMPSGVRAEDLAELERVSQSMDTMDYFELLHCEKSAPPVEIKRSFYKWSRVFHPDKFYQLQDKELKGRVNDVYKRITEAYYMLRDDVKRAKYLGDIAGPERAQKLRFTEASELETKVAKKKELEEQVGTHPKGRQFFQTGMADLEAGRWSGAERNFKMALTYEPQNAKYKEKMKEASDKIFGETRERGDQFKIK